ARGRAFRLPARKAPVPRPRDARPGALAAGLRSDRPRHRGQRRAGLRRLDGHRGRPLSQPPATDGLDLRAARAASTRPGCGLSVLRRKAGGRLGTHRGGEEGTAIGEGNPGGGGGRDMGIDVNRERAIDLAVSQIEKQFGKGAIMKLGEDALAQQDIQALPTGSLGLDLALGVGGVPRGRVIEIYGPESSGKTTLALHLIAEAQKRGGICAFIDAGHALDISYARKLGVKSEDLLISQPDNGEQALEIADTLVRSGAIDVLTIDSVAALVPRAEIEGDMGDPQMGLQARLMSQALRKLTGTISKSRTIV